MVFNLFTEYIQHRVPCSSACSSSSEKVEVAYNGQFFHSIVFHYLAAQLFCIQVYVASECLADEQPHHVGRQGHWAVFGVCPAEHTIYHILAIQHQFPSRGDAVCDDVVLFARNLEVAEHFATYHVGIPQPQFLCGFGQVFIHFECYASVRFAQYSAIGCLCHCCSIHDAADNLCDDSFHKHLLFLYYNSCQCAESYSSYLKSGSNFTCWHICFKYSSMLLAPGFINNRNVMLR